MARQKICIHCKQTFESYHTTRKYCSHRCYSDARQLYERKKTCVICSANYTPYARGSAGERSKTCSKRCAGILNNLHRMKRLIHKCPQCNKDFETNRARSVYCSMACHSAFQTTLTGEKSAGWKGGRTSLTRLLRASSKYKNWRKAVFERDNYTCQFCSARGVELNADHILPWAFFIESRFDIDNGRTLCVPCHRATDTFGSRAFKHKEAV